MVALSALGSDASRAALCGSSAAAAAGAAAATAAQAQSGAQPGCVLPVVDAAPAPVAQPMPPAPTPPPPVAPMGGGFAISPLLLGLAAIAAGVLAAVLLKKGGDEDESPE